MTLRDGRELGYVLYGNPAGHPWILLHGTPGSRLWFLEDDPVGQELGLRWIGTDRPGYGRSDPRPQRNLLDFADDLRQLTEHLNLRRFGLLGVSGGGAFALACASHLGPERVERVCLVASPSPPDPTENNRHGLSRRLGSLLSKILPRRRGANRSLETPSIRCLREQPDRFFTQFAKRVGKWDRKILDAPGFRRSFEQHVIEAYRQGTDGHRDETELLTSDWGFSLDGLEVRVDIWHGTEDRLAPLDMAQALNKQIPGSRLHVVPGRGHLLVEDEGQWRTIAESLCS